MKCEICGSSEPVKDALGLDEAVWIGALVLGTASIDAHPACLKKAIISRLERDG